MNNENYDLYYTVVKNRDEKEIKEDKIDYEKNEDEYNSFDDYIIPNQHVRKKAHETISR